MGSGSAGSELQRHLNTLTYLGVVGNLTDGQLLERVVTGREEAAQAAFSVLVERHGPMVLRVCRQVLGDDHDSHDAFQATFLVLARRAGSVRRADSVACWLHGVARRVAVRSRSDAARRRVHEKRWAELRGAGGTEQDERAGSWPELHEEIARLPRRYREPVVLCYLEGLTTEAAARSIGCPQGTVLSRLSRARERLRGQLTRRGVAFSAGLLMSGAATDRASAAVPAALLDATVRASLQFAGSKTAVALATTTAAALARGVLHAMTIAKFATLGTATLACVVALGGVYTFGQRGGAGGTGQTPSPLTIAGNREVR
jgi:RNA polymerase sigma factor (sigma-70 family)